MTRWPVRQKKQDMTVEEKLDEYLDALDIDLDRSEFSLLDTEGGYWLKYAVPDVLSALWHSQRNLSLTSEQQQTIFDSRLDGMEIYTPEAPDMEEETSPTMGLSM